MNLLPVPVLDGGHLVFYALEGIRGKALSPKTQEYAFRIGLTCILVMMLFATSNDVRRIFDVFG
jgi:regulator of sigma E protease